MIPSTVDGKPVKNLGWLLRNWRTIQQIDVYPHPVTIAPFQPDCLLRVTMQDGRVYETGFADAQVLRDWLKRPTMQWPTTWHSPSL